MPAHWASPPSLLGKSLLQKWGWECEAWSGVSIACIFHAELHLCWTRGCSQNFLGDIVTQYFFLRNILWLQIHIPELMGILHSWHNIDITLYYPIPLSLAALFPVFTSLALLLQALIPVCIIHNLTGCIGFLLLPEWITTNVEALNNTNFLFHSFCRSEVQPTWLPSLLRVSRGWNPGLCWPRISSGGLGGAPS